MTAPAPLFASRKRHEFVQWRSYDECARCGKSRDAPVHFAGVQGTLDSYNDRVTAAKMLTQMSTRNVELTSEVN